MLRPTQHIALLIGIITLNACVQAKPLFGVHDHDFIKIFAENNGQKIYSGGYNVSQAVKAFTDECCTKFAQFEMILSRNEFIRHNIYTREENAEFFKTHRKFIPLTTSDTKVFSFSRVVSAPLASARNYSIYIAINKDEQITGIWARTTPANHYAL